MSNDIIATRNTLRLVELFQCKTGSPSFTVAMRCMLDTTATLMKEEERGYQLLTETPREGLRTQSFSGIVRDSLDDPIYKNFLTDENVTLRNIPNAWRRPFDSVKARFSAIAGTELSDSAAFNLMIASITKLSEVRSPARHRDSGASFGYTLWSKGEKQACLIAF